MKFRPNCSLTVVVFVASLFGVTHVGTDALTFTVNGVPSPASTAVTVNTPQTTNAPRIPVNTPVTGAGQPQPPIGALETNSGDVPRSACKAAGWAFDPDEPDQNVNVRMLVDGTPLAQGMKADIYRADLESTWNNGGGGCPGGTCGFEANLWDLVSHYQTHAITVEAQDLQTGVWASLNAAPKILTCRTYDIYTYEPLTGTTTQMTYLPDTDEYSPSWSPNERQIAYDVVSADGSREIYVTDVKAGETKTLRGAGTGSSHPTWSPNGKWIAFDRTENGTSSLYLISPTGGQAGLVRKDAASAHWAPGSKRLVFQGSDHSIKTIAVDGGTGEEMLVTPSGNNPVWSFDGNWIVFDLWGDIWKVAVDAIGKPLGDPVKVTSNSYDESHPTLSPDGKTIAYLSNFNNDWDIWTVAAAGGEGSLLTGAPTYADYDPSYAKHTQILAYASITPSPKTLPKLGLRVNYGNDWVESFYEAGHTVWVTLTESDGVTVKASIKEITEPKSFWDGSPGFTSYGGQWEDSRGKPMISPPDIQPYDWVFARVDNGAGAQVRIGDIQGEVRFDQDSITGTILAPWLTDLVQFQCLDWGMSRQPPYPNFEGSSIRADGSDSYTCSWDPQKSWDVQPWQDIGVGYSTTDGNWVANAFRDERWYALWTADLAPGAWAEGEHNYQFHVKYTLPEPGNQLSSPAQTLRISSGDALIYPGKVLLQASKASPQIAWTGSSCEVVQKFRRNQATRFVWGWVNDRSMSYMEAFDHFSSFVVTAYSDGDAGSATSLTMGELMPWTPQVPSWDDRCALTEHGGG